MGPICSVCAGRPPELSIGALSLAGSGGKEEQACIRLHKWMDLSNVGVFLLQSFGVESRAWWVQGHRQDKPPSQHQCRRSWSQSTRWRSWGAAACQSLGT